jgi:bifunctional N-acetylglucosamine-1-phosphate-uridyltransferase/glucosamine-1-phosphate-acetyltransferase GlmU-like protein
LIAAAAAALIFTISPGHAAYIGNAPWCVVVNIGAGDVEWTVNMDRSKPAGPT